MKHTINVVPGDDLTIDIHVEKSIIDWLYISLKALDESHAAYVCALSHLIGISDVAAVKHANEIGRSQGWEIITTSEFRKWLPRVLSQFFKEALEQINES